MLRIILLSLAWATCSTCLVRPWFWKGVKNKYLFESYGKIGFSREAWKVEVFGQIMLFILVFGISVDVYERGMRQNLYGSLTMVLSCVIGQFIWDNQGRKLYTIMATIIAITAILCIQDTIAKYKMTVPLLSATQFDEDTDEKFFISASEIESLFNAKSATGPSYNNGKYIFTVEDGDYGNGIVIIEKDNYAEAKFLPILYEFEVVNLRSQYPTQELRELYIAVSDYDEPYGVFALAEKSGILGTYDVKGYVMLNLMTGNIQEFKQEELPNFVIKN